MSFELFLKIVKELELRMCSGSEFQSQIIGAAKENERLPLADFMLGTTSRLYLYSILWEPIFKLSYSNQIIYLQRIC